MSDEENVGVETEIQNISEQEIASPSEAVQQHNDDEQEAIQSASRKRSNDAERNWAEARRKMQELERRAQEYEAELMRLKTQNQPKEEEDPLEKLSSDDIITKAQAEKLAERRAQKIVEQYLHQKEAETVEERIQAKYPDFQAVVNEDSISFLKQNHPEIAESLNALKSNPYKQAKAVYDAVKAFVPRQSTQTLVEKKKAIENSQKPLSVQAAPKQSAIGQVHMFENGLTPALKKQLWEEMQQAKKFL